jgi:hypothetical protein
MPETVRAGHPRGETGVRRSLDLVAKRVCADRLDEDVIEWARKVLFDAGNPKGPRARTEAILKALKLELIWVPDPTDAEFIAKAGKLVGKNKKFWAGDCDEQVVALGAALGAVGVKVLVDGVGYHPGEITHVLLWAHDGQRWLAVDPSTNHPVGSWDTPARERVLNPYTGEVLCDSTSCMRDGRWIPDDVIYRREEGDYVGVGGTLGEAPVDRGDLGYCPEPTSYDEASLKAYAACEGDDAAVQLVKDQTGVNIAKCVGGTTVDWKCAAGKVTQYYTGIDPTGIFNDDGSINWNAVAVEASAAAAAAFCTAFGGGAAAPLCSAFGAQIGMAFTNIANAISAAWSEKSPPGFVAERGDLTVYQYLWSDYRLLALLSIRAMAATSYAAMKKLGVNWEKVTGEKLTMDQVEGKLVLLFGWKRPDGWRLVGAPNPFIVPLPHMAEMILPAGTVIGAAYKMVGASATTLSAFDKEFGLFAHDAVLTYIVRHYAGYGDVYDIANVYLDAGPYAVDRLPGDTQDFSYEPRYLYTNQKLNQMLDYFGANATVFKSMQAVWITSFESAARLMMQDAVKHPAPSFSLETAPPASSKSNAGLWWLFALGAAGGGYYYARKKRLI